MKMPVLFVGHGSPMNAIEDNEFSSGWKEMASRIPKPSAILCISAHWVAEGTAVTAMEKPKTIHDFYGFPKALYDVQYPAKGSPTLAEKIKRLVKTAPVSMDKEWGLDHGTWSVLVRMYPKADIPVLQLSLNTYLSPQNHFDIGKELTSLRDENILIVGSGNAVHNLMVMNPRGSPYPWAVEFDTFVKESLEAKDFPSLIDYQKQSIALQAHPTNEHYLPLLYTIGASNKEKPVFFKEKMFYASLSMRCVAYGLK